MTLSLFTGMPMCAIFTPASRSQPPATSSTGRSLQLLEVGEVLVVHAEGWLHRDDTMLSPLLTAGASSILLTMPARPWQSRG